MAISIGPKRNANPTPRRKRTACFRLAAGTAAGSTRAVLMLFWRRRIERKTLTYAASQNLISLRDCHSRSTPAQITSAPMMARSLGMAIVRVLRCARRTEEMGVALRARGSPPVATAMELGWKWVSGRWRPLWSASRCARFDGLPRYWGRWLESRGQGACDLRERR